MNTGSLSSSNNVNKSLVLWTTGYLVFSYSDQWIEQYWEQGESQDLKKLADEAVRKVLG